MNHAELPADAEAPNGADKSNISHAGMDAKRSRQNKAQGGDAAGPAQVPIPEFMHAVAQGDLDRAAEILRSGNPVSEGNSPGHCELTQQVTSQVLPTRIGHLVRFVSDWERMHADGKKAAAPWRPHRVAIIGSGPAGMVCAGALARAGYPVTIFEGLERAGGVLRYGVQETYFPESILDWELTILKRLGVEIYCNVMVGKKIHMEDLVSEMGFDAVFVATGAGMTHFLGIPGENLSGVYTSAEFLTRVNLGEAFENSGKNRPFQLGRSIAVVGADSEGIDAVCAALGHGSMEGHIVCRGPEEEIAASLAERQRAVDAGFRFHWFVEPVEILGGENGEVVGLKCVKLKQGDLGSSDDGAEPIPGSEFTLQVENVVIAGGAPPNPLEVAPDDKNAIDHTHGFILEERKCLPSREQIYNGAKAGRGAAAVIVASAAGKRAAEAIHTELCREDWSEIKAEDEWNDFIDWCRGIENSPHE